MEGMMVSPRFQSRRGGAGAGGCAGHPSPTPQIRRGTQQHQQRLHWRAAAGCSSASIWRTITPPDSAPASAGLPRPLPGAPAPCGEEGSWNAAWDARPARWLHGPASAWLLFGVRSPSDPTGDRPDESPPSDDPLEEEESGSPVEEQYRVTGVLGDGRCLFRAIVYGAYISCGKEAPDENSQREFADELRHQVVQELLKRREELEWSVEGDFDAYIENIQQPWAWGGEMELLMASHVLKLPISVFMINKSSGNLLNIANYGHGYEKDGVDAVKVLFHGYGHYEALEVFNHQ